MKVKELFRRFSFERLILAYFLVVLVIIASIVVVSYRIARQSRTNKEWVTHTQQVLAGTDTLLSQQKDLVIVLRGFAATGNPDFLAGLAEKEAAVHKGLADLKLLTRDNRELHRRLDSLQVLFGLYKTMQQELTSLQGRAIARSPEVVRLVEEGDSILKAQNTLFRSIQKNGQQLLAQRTAAYQQTVERSATVVRVLLLVFVFSLLLAFFLAYRNSRQRSRAEAALRKSQQLIGGIIEHAPVLINVKDLEGRFILANRQLAYALQTTPEELVGKTNEAFMAASMAAAIRHEDEEVVRTGQPSEMEVKLPGPDGIHSYITSKFPLYDENGQLYAVGSTSADITPVKQAHEALAHHYEQQQRILNGLQDIVSAFSDMICIVNEAGEFMMVSDTVQKLLGYAPKELMSKRFIDFVAEEDQPQTRLIARQIMSGQPVSEFTNQYRCKDGRLRPLIWSAKWLEEDRLMYCIARDGSERLRVAEQLAQSRARLAHAQTIARLGNWEWDLQKNTWSCSDEVYTLLGLKKEETPNIHQAFLDAVHPDDRGELDNMRAAALRTGTKVDIEHRIIRPDGRVCYMHTRGEATLNEEGKPIWFSGTIQDITDRKKAEIALQEMNRDLQRRAQELKASNAELERFAYVASHDLQEPLRMVSSFLALLQKKLQGQLDDTAKQYIHFAVDGAERMKRLIQDLLNYSRLGTRDEPMAPVDLNETWSQVVQTFDSVISETGAVVQSEKLPVVQGRKTQLTQLLQNLVGNALKYRSEAPPHIRLHCSEKEDHWQFCIRDNGIGIDPKFFDKIFIIFQRLHNKSEYSGTGIGLAVCKKIVERHGGTIWVASEPGSGSSFYFTLKKLRHA